MRAGASSRGHCGSRPGPQRFSTFFHIPPRPALDAQCVFPFGESTSGMRTRPSQTLWKIVEMLQSVWQSALHCMLLSMLHYALGCVLHAPARGTTGRRRSRRCGSRMDADGKQTPSILPHDARTPTDGLNAAIVYACLHGFAISEVPPDFDLR